MGNTRRIWAWALLLGALLAAAPCARAQAEATDSEPSRRHQWTEVSAVSSSAFERQAQSHTETVTTATTYLCGDCGQTKQEIESVTLEPAAHVFDFGICKVCGYACRHEETVTREAPSDAGTVSHYAPLDEEHHTKYRTAQVDEYCKICGTYLSTETQTVEEAVLLHNFTDGFCVDCGYAPSPAAGQSRDGRGKTEEASRLRSAAGAVDALTDAVERLRARQPDTTVVITGAQELMTAWEYKLLLSLDTREQILAVLAVCGLDELASDAADTGSLPVDAQTLLNEIRARLLAAGEDELAEITALREIWFPVEEIDVDGSTAQACILELVAASGDTLAVRRFGLLRDAAGDWALEDLGGTGD